MNPLDLTGAALLKVISDEATPAETRALVRALLLDAEFQERASMLSLLTADIESEKRTQLCTELGFLIFFGANEILPKPVEPHEVYVSHIGALCTPRATVVGEPELLWASDPRRLVSRAHAGARARYATVRNSGRGGPRKTRVAATDVEVLTSPALAKALRACCCLFTLAPSFLAWGAS